MWYRKRDDVAALHVAQQCGISAEFQIVGSVLHKDDLEQIRVQLFGVMPATITQLFTKTEI